MKDTINLIPQVFYDLIGRVVPGAAIILATFLLFASGDLSAPGQFFEEKLGISSAGGSFTIWLLASYLVGTLSGAIGFALFESGHSERPEQAECLAEWKDPSFLRALAATIGFRKGGDVRKSKNLSNIQAQAPPDGGASIRGSHVPYIYDYILIRDSATGGRLAKLRAESHMCRVLFVGGLFLSLAYAVEALLTVGPAVLWSIQFWMTLLLLGVVERASYLLNAHLAVRTRRLLVNCWAILKQQEEAQRKRC